MKRPLYGAFPGHAIYRVPFAASIIVALGAAACPAIASVQPGAVGSDPLRFPVEQFILKTVTVKTPTGARKVVYRSYEHLPYVTKPVDKNYESLDVRVPVSINGRPVDASRAPILLIVGVGGYLSSPNVHNVSTMAAGPPPSGRPGGPPGGPGVPGGPPGGPGGPPGGPGAGGGFASMGLAEGWVIVLPGARGRENRDKEGNYYGKAPAAIVDLKAAVRYVRYNQGVLPGNDEQIISTGCSAGGVW